MVLEVADLSSLFFLILFKFSTIGTPFFYNHNFKIINSYRIFYTEEEPVEGFTAPGKDRLIECSLLSV
jgi:hypothetical protein